ncbi:MAG: hypothetical protein EXS37_08410 [Opitutus sp.]|nr:hypothetical protein [Opitutus sp.]
MKTKSKIYQTPRFLRVGRDGNFGFSWFRLSRGVFLGAAWLGLLSVAQATNLVPAARQTKPLLLTGGTVVTVSGPVLAPADVLVVDGKISRIGPSIPAPAGAEVINVKGRYVYPGLIAAQTHLGLTEISALRQTVDTAELGAINPNARTQTAINPDSELIPVARANGVLTALVVPAERASGAPRGNLIAGTSTLIRLDGWTWEDLTIRAPLGLHVFWPVVRLNRPDRNAKAPAAAPRDGDGETRALDDAFVAARSYAQAKAAGRAGFETDLRWEAMLPAMRGEQRVFVHAEELKQIRAALAFAIKHALKIVIIGGLDAWRAAEDLKAADVPVIVGGTNRLPRRRDDDHEAAYANPARLHAAGVRFCIAGGISGPAEVGNERNLPYHAARAAAHGLPREVALRAVTLGAAEVLGIEAELGSIEVGKRGTLIVTDGDPLEIPTQVTLAFIDGAPVDLRSRHTQLYEKYRERLRRLEPAAGK